MMLLINPTYRGEVTYTLLQIRHPQAPMNSLSMAASFHKNVNSFVKTTEGTHLGLLPPLIK